MVFCFSRAICYYNHIPRRAFGSNGSAACCHTLPWSFWIFGPNEDDSTVAPQHGQLITADLPNGLQLGLSPCTRWHFGGNYVSRCQLRSSLCSCHLLHKKTAASQVQVLVNVLELGGHLNRKEERVVWGDGGEEGAVSQKNSHFSCREITNTNLTLECALNLCTYFALTLPFQVRHKIPEQHTLCW